MWRGIPSVALVAAGLAACTDYRSATAPATTQDQSATIAQSRADGAAKRDLRAGAVFAMTNQAAGNAIAAYARGEDGSLTFVGTFPTGGLGAGAQPDPLRSQGSLIRGAKQGEDEGNDLLFAVNAGSNEISVLRIDHHALTLVSKISSGGVRPTSLALRHRLLYVMNAGSGTINGFRVSKKGELTPIPGSARPISGGSTADPSQISFSPDGRLLVVPGKTLNNIDTYLLNKDGTTIGPRMNHSNGLTPFGFAFDHHHHIVVSEAFGGAPGAGAASSYAVSKNGELRVVSGSVPDGQTAPCWLVITNNGHYVYVTNTGSSDISSYRLHPDGTLTLLMPIAATTDPGSTPIDEALTAGSRYLYVLNDVTGTIDGYRVEHNGTLSRVATVSGLPPNAQGLTAR
jgi:6-phosphogluconolactonase (cycloisomerase 2 family)